MHKEMDQSNSSCKCTIWSECSLNIGELACGNWSYSEIQMSPNSIIGNFADEGRERRHWAAVSGNVCGTFHGQLHVELVKLPYILHCVPFIKDRSRMYLKWQQQVRNIDVTFSRYISYSFISAPSCIVFYFAKFSHQNLVKVYFL